MTEWINSVVTDLLQTSPPVMLATVLFFVGMGLKRSPLADWFVPILLGITGGLLWPFMAEPVHLDYEVRNPFVLNSIYGVGIGAMPTWLHQTVKQFRDREKHDDGGTKVFHRKEEPAEQQKGTQ